VLHGRRSFLLRGRQVVEFREARMNKKMMRKMLRDGRRAARKAAWEFATGKKTWEELHLISEQLRDLAAEYDTMKGYTEYLLCREREEQ